MDAPETAGFAALLEEIERATPDGRREASARYVALAREQMRHDFERGVLAPSPLLRVLSDRCDALIGALHRATRTPSSAMLALSALGGYGRGELFPYSDLDLLILHEEGEDELSSRLVEQLIYPLWDAKVQVGYAIRGIEETIALASRELSVCTSLLDARLLAGHEGLFHALSAAAHRAFFGPEVKRFIASLKEERATRHRRFGETVYLLEPNIKLGKGGLRDLNLGLWAAKASFGVADFAGLAAVQGATPRQQRALREAQEMFGRLRLAMHFHAGRSQDHLLFELQEALAPRLFPDEDLPGVPAREAAVTPAVERLMHAYYRHARSVVVETDALLDRCGREARAPLTGAGATRASDREGEHLLIADGALASVEPARFWERPAELLHAFRLSARLGLPLHPATRDLIAEAAAGDPGAQLPADAEASELWLELLCEPEREGAGSVLLDAHDLGVVTAMIPELAPCTGRVQHDLYHVYTVDLHSLYVVAQLKAWRRGEQQEQHPLAVALFSRLARPRTLFLAALLHDVAKPLGRGHSHKGARLARGVAARLGLSAEEQQAVASLVEAHLTMAHLAQRRDLSDPRVIRTLAAEVKSVEQLRQLYLLTLADTAMTAPGNLSEWKATLLEELYLRCYVELGHGEGIADAERARQREERGTGLELMLRKARGDSARGVVARIPTEMVLAHELDDLVHHLGVALDLEAGGGLLRVIARRRSGVAAVEVTICCADAPGRLALITGVMLAHRIEVLAAQVYTVEGAAGAAATVLDVFTVRLPNADPEEDDEVWAGFSADLEQAIAGELDVPDLVSRHTRPSTLAPRVVPRVEPAVSIDNQVSERYTVIDVQAPDRLGVLHAITRALSEQGLAIHLSKVATEAGRVVDIFYVSDGRNGGKLVAEARQDEVRAAVVAAIEALTVRREEAR
jgi:[protein-PII] uridylyltransferase